MKMINYLVSRTKNLGDKCSAPGLYFTTGVQRDVCDLRDMQPRSTFPKGCVLVLGGGGMLHDFWLKKLTPILRKPRPYKVVVWGAGHNSGRLSKDYPDWLADCDLVGVRDMQPHYRWIPCVSCISPDFDIVRDIRPTRKFVLYDHVDHSIPHSKRLKRQLPYATNCTFESLRGALQFLAQGEIVVTTSYHGAYWATLLGRGVIAYPWSSKFWEMPFAPRLLQKTLHWDHVRTGVPTYPEALKTCRDATMGFWGDVKKLVKEAA